MAHRWEKSLGVIDLATKSLYVVCSRLGRKCDSSAQEEERIRAMRTRDDGSKDERKEGQNV